MTQLSAILFLVVLPFTHSFADSATSAGLPHPGPRSSDQAAFLFDEATVAQRDGKVDLAVEDYQKLLKNYPQFSKKFIVYQELMKLHLGKKKYNETLKLGKEALLLHPSSGIYSAIQLMRAEAQLRSGSALQTKITIDELLKSKPDSNTVSNALLYKAEALSLMGKHKEAFASLDAGKSNEKFADVELKVRARACAAKKLAKKEALLDFFHEKNLCYKESAALAKSMPALESAQVWCDHFHGFESELKKAALDEFTLKKLEAELQGSLALSATWGCK